MFLSILAIVVVLLVESSTSTKNLALETNDVSDHIISTSVNFLFDLFLKHYTNSLIKEGKTQIQIPNFEERFSTKIVTLDIEGAIEFTNGWASNISTIHRTGDADISRIGEDFVLTAHLGFRDLKVDYKSYDISFLGEHQKGEILVTIGKNSLWLKLSVQLKPTCLITLNDLKIETLDNIEVDITNLGIFENFTDDITSWVINEVTKWYRHYIEQIVAPELAKSIKDADLCKYWPIH